MDMLTYQRRPSLQECDGSLRDCSRRPDLLGFNEVRYGSVFDRTMALFAPDVAQKFAIRYLPMNLYKLLFMGPSVNTRFPYLHPEGGGQALILTSPAFLLALRPSFRRLIPSALMVAAVMSVIPSLLFYSNGFVQFGTHHYVHAFLFCSLWWL